MIDQEINVADSLFDEKDLPRLDELWNEIHDSIPQYPLTFTKGGVEYKAIGKAASVKDFDHDAIEITVPQVIELGGKERTVVAFEGLIEDDMPNYALKKLNLPSSIQKYWFKGTIWSPVFSNMQSITIGGKKAHGALENFRNTDNIYFGDELFEPMDDLHFKNYEATLAAKQCWDYYQATDAS